MLILFLAGIALAAEATDADKLKIREAQLIRMTLTAQIAELEGQYRDLRAALDKATASEQAALADLGKRLNCTLDPKTLTCAATKPEVGK